MWRTLLALSLTLAILSGDVSSGLAQQRKAAGTQKAAPKNAASGKTAPKAAPPKINLPTQAPKTEVEVAPVKPELREQAVRSAVRIDRLVEAALNKAGQKPNDEASDEQLVRRLYLDITGTIPTARQADLFLRARAESKTPVLVDALLSRPGYASQMYNWMGDFLRLVDRVDGNTYLRPYSDWVKQCLRDNVTWDRMASQMLSAEGRVWDNPPAGFVLRDPGMPLDNLNNAVRIFLGTRIGCAQCHDHPFDRWTQKEFYQLAAFTAGTEYRLPGSMNFKVSNKDVDTIAPGGTESMEARNARAILRFNRDVVFHNEKRQLKFPHDYQYDNAKPDQIATPAVLFGTAPSTIAPKERRKVFADWATSPDNPRFALTMANRLWRKAMGIGLIEPVDDLKDDSVAVNPELMTFLAEELKRLKFDLKEFQRIIYYTKTYQRRVTYDELDPEKPYLFPGPLLRRLTAEQVWDSLLTLTLEDPDAILRPEDDQYVKTIALTQTATAQQVIDKAKQLDEVRKAENQERNKRLYKGMELVRASELPTPLPEGHFLRQFGQSDRAVINDSHTDGTVPQLLTMFNGPVTHMMLERGSVIYNEVVAEKDTEDQINRIFLCLLSRRPNATERSAAQKEIKAAGPAGYGNVIWALLNTREFLFVQ